MPPSPTGMSCFSVYLGTATTAATAVLPSINSACDVSVLPCTGELSTSACDVSVLPCNGELSTSACDVSVLPCNGELSTSAGGVPVFPSVLPCNGEWSTRVCMWYFSILFLSVLTGIREWSTSVCVVFQYTIPFSINRYQGMVYQCVCGISVYYSLQYCHVKGNGLATSVCGILEYYFIQYCHVRQTFLPVCVVFQYTIPFSIAM